MICPRCHGLMAQEPSAEIDYDYDGVQPWRQEGYRCLLCGNYRDPVIDRNRALIARYTEP